MHHGAQTGMARRKDGRVPIEHMRLDYRLSGPNSPERKRILEINRALGRAALRGDGSEGASQLTAVRVRNNPVAWLVSTRKIGGDEFRAALEIETAVMALSGALMFKPLSMEKTSPGRREDWDDRTSAAVERYRRFADHWSDRRSQYGDRTLEILIGALVDQRPFSQIESDIGLRHGRASLVTIRGLRDYAARAGFVDRGLAARWKAEAAQSFRASAYLQRLAVNRARFT